jgi:hypothetical protein
VTEHEAKRRLAHVDSRLAIHSSAMRQLESEKAELLARLTDATGCPDNRPLANVAKGGI